MNTGSGTADNAQREQPKRRKLRYVLLSTGLLIVFVTWYVLYWGKPDFGSQKLVDTLPCGNGDYKLLHYATANGNGRLDLVDKNGKVLASTATSSTAGVGQPTWDEDCKGVLVNGKNEIERLEVSH